MPHDAPPKNPPAKKAPPAKTARTCPQCRQLLDAAYTCGCPERWENEGGAPTPEDQAS